MMYTNLETAQKWRFLLFQSLKFLAVLFCHLAEPSEEAGGDENRRREKTNHAALYRSAGHWVRKHEVWFSLVDRFITFIYKITDSEETLQTRFRLQR